MLSEKVLPPFHHFRRCLQKHKSLYQDIDIKESDSTFWGDSWCSGLLVGACERFLPLSRKLLSRLVLMLSGASGLTGIAWQGTAPVTATGKAFALCRARRQVFAARVLAGSRGSPASMLFKLASTVWSSADARLPASAALSKRYTEAKLEAIPSTPSTGPCAIRPLPEVCPAKCACFVALQRSQCLSQLNK